MPNNPQTPSKLAGKGLKKLQVTGDKSCRQVPENDNEGEKEEQIIQVGYQFIKSMINAMVNPISYKDKNGVFIGINESYARQVFGLSEEKIIGYTLLEICTSSAEKFDKRSTASGKCFMDVCREWGESDAKLLASGGNKTHEQEVTLADGTRGIFLVNRSAFKDKNGKVLGLFTVLQDITELRISERAILESDERYRIITEQTGQLVYDNNLENNNLSLAGAVEEIFGYSVEESRGFNLGDWIQHIHSDDIEYVLKKFMTARKTGGRERVEYRLRKKNGNYIDVEDTGTYLLNNDGKPYRVLGVVKDITEQKVIRAQLEKNKEKYKIVTEQTEQIVYDYDFISDTVYLEGAVEKVTGYPLQNFDRVSLGAWKEYIHPDDLKHTTEELTRAQKYGGKYRIEFRFRKKDGTYFCAEDNGVCLLDESGMPYKLLGVIKDVTERKLSQKKLEISEEKYRSFIHNFKGIAFQLNENLIPEFVHGAVEDITGYTDKDFMSGQFSWEELVYPEDQSSILKKIMRIKNSPYAHSTEFEYRIKRKDGKVKWVNELYQKIPGKNGKPDKYQGAIYDISEKKEAEDALAEIKETRIKEIHHRIKNNLQVISSLLSLQAEKFEDKNVREAFRESQDRVTSMGLIHEELYQEKGAETLNFAAYIEKLSDSLLKTYRLDHPHVNLKTDLQEDIFLDIDTAVPLGIVVNELVSNSLKHAFPGKKNGEIQIRLSKIKNENRPDKAEYKDLEASGLCVAVSDNGIGISENIDIKSPDTLGLQLVSALIDQLDGGFELKKDKGTEFIIRINKG